MIDYKKTKIICTIGPASNNYKIIKELIKSGMNVARLNFSHGTIEEHDKTIDLIREIAKELNANVSILQDLPGPKIRIGKLDKTSYQIKKNDKIFLSKKSIIGDNTKFSCSYKEVVDLLLKGDEVFINDGLIKFIVKQKKDDGLIIEAMNEGEIRSHKGMNIPSEHFNIDVITKEDIKFINFGIKKDIDFIAVSFVRKKEDIFKVKKIIKQSGKNIYVIAKIENPSALKNIDEIIEASDGIMVARGDLGIETPIEKIALIQKDLINNARKNFKITIVATQMLRSMVESPVPTRAEVSDITNAIIDGTDAIMLSEETAIGFNPVLVCKTMNNICLAVEKEIDIKYSFKNFENETVIYPELAMCFAAQDIAEKINIKSIAILTKSGKTARLISSIKINKPVFAFTDDKKVIKYLNLCWGVLPFNVDIDKEKNSTKQLLDYIKKNKLLSKGSLFIIIGKTCNSINITTNIIELQSAL